MVIQDVIDVDDYNDTAKLIFEECARRNNTVVKQILAQYTTITPAQINTLKTQLNGIGFATNVSISTGSLATKNDLLAILNAAKSAYEVIIK